MNVSSAAFPKVLYPEKSNWMNSTLKPLPHDPTQTIYLIHLKGKMDQPLFNPSSRICHQLVEMRSRK